VQADRPVVEMADDILVFRAQVVEGSTAALVAGSKTALVAGSKTALVAVSTAVWAVLRAAWVAVRAAAWAPKLVRSPSSEQDMALWVGGGEERGESERRWVRARRTRPRVAARRAVASWTF